MRDVSNSRARSLDAFLIPSDRPKLALDGSVASGEENSVPRSRALGSFAFRRDAASRDDERSARARARWGELTAAVVLLNQTAESSRARSRATSSVARAAYAFATTRANANRTKRRRRGETFVRDLRAIEIARGAGNGAHKRARAFASGAALRASGEYGALALPLGSSTRVAARNNAVNAIEFDRDGANATIGTNGGAIEVFAVNALRETRGEVYAPKTRVWTDRYIEALTWNHARDAIMTVSDSSNEVIAYRADAREVGARARRGEAAPASAVLRRFVASAREREGSGFGLHDLVRDPKDPHAIIASASHGQVFMWDERVAGDKHRGELSSHVKSSLSSLVVSDDGHTVIGGEGERGDLIIWDIRKQSAKAGSTFGMLGAKMERYDVIAQLSISKLLQKTALAEAVKIQNAGVHWIGCDPADSRRLGYHLANGWSGVIDLMKPCVTHAHCPPAPWLEVDQPTNAVINDVERSALSVPICDLRRRRACWLPDGTAFAVGLGVKPGVRVLDFAATPKSRQWVHGLTVADLDREPEERYASGIPTMFIETSTKIFTVAAHPCHRGEIIAGGESSLSLLGYVATSNRS